MPNFDDFRGSVGISVSRTLNGYDVTIVEYEQGVAVNTRTQSFNTRVGLIQAAYPSIYQTITNVSELGTSLTLNLTTNKGLRHLCANCTSLTEFNVDQVVLPSEGLYSNEYAFYNCSALTKVVVGDKLATGSGIFGTIIGESMFEGCTNLPHIYESYTSDADNVLATIDLSQSLVLCRNMFKGCRNLAGLKLKNGTGDNDIMAEQVLDGITYEHGYDYLGLKDYQFEIVNN